ncbi:5-hydroxyisourate hydrolase [Thraustotheca clavata]|uniref:hydroxyisourate hydrolase n=1 Tax=Thraustotheca clavata TaxID=74557 RepID=A0A1V9ZQL2_9STRA|nr:5-hydroxyisourate hydrolase [Thraustotheca clavata]
MNRLDVIKKHTMVQPPVTSHVLDTSRGCPAQGMLIVLERQTGGNWTTVGSGVTNADGRVSGLTHVGQDLTGTCRITFETQAYFEQNNIPEYFFPFVSIVFKVKCAEDHYHVPLLINPFGYSTYRAFLIVPIMVKYLETNDGALNGIDVLEGVSIASWRPDASHDRCNACVKKFRLFRRKHHCRVCGEIYCYKCLQQRYVHVPLAGTAMTYVCVWCVDLAPREPLLSRGAPSTQKSPQSLPPSEPAQELHIQSFEAAKVIISPMPIQFHTELQHLSAFTPTGEATVETLPGICSLMCSAIECSYGAIVLYEEPRPLTVVTQQGLGSFVLTDAFRILCNRAVNVNRVCSLNYTSGAYQFCSTAPLIDPSTKKTIGCVIVLDTIEKEGINPSLTLPYYARLAVDQLALLSPKRKLSRPLCCSFQETHSKLISIRRLSNVTLS